jgi:hypothetical protein
MAPLEIFKEHRDALQSLASSKFDAEERVRAGE